MSAVEIPGQDPLLKEVPASEQNAEQTDKKNPDKKEQADQKESKEKPKNDLITEELANIEKRIDAGNARMNTFKNQKENHEAARLALKEQAAKEDRLKTSDYPPDIITDVATAMQAPEGVTKPDKGPPGEDRQEAQLAKGKEVDQKEVAKQVENPEAKPTAEAPKTQVAAVEQKTEAKTEQNAQFADAKAAQKAEGIEGANQAGGRVA